MLNAATRHWLSRFVKPRPEVRRKGLKRPRAYTEIVIPAILGVVFVAVVTFVALGFLLAFIGRVTGVDSSEVADAAAVITTGTAPGGPGSGL